MPREIERKFLVRDVRIVPSQGGELIEQGYVAKEAGAMTTRVRIRGARAYLTLKGPLDGIARDEFEYEIPVADARHILSTYCGACVVRKTRHLVPHADHTFEIDVFAGRHQGLVIAEVELSDASARVQLPDWLGEEVTGNRRYGNYYLAHCASLAHAPIWPQVPMPPRGLNGTNASALFSH